MVPNRTLNFEISHLKPQTFLTVNKISLNLSFRDDGESLRF